jgi:hypothetical protein
MQRSMGDILEMKLKATLLKRFGLDGSFPEHGLILIESYIRHPEYHDCNSNHVPLARDRLVAVSFRKSSQVI